MVVACLIVRFFLLVWFSNEACEKLVRLFVNYGYREKKIYDNDCEAADCIMEIQNFLM